MGSLTGKSIVITGAGRGIGAAYARLASGEGANVVVNDIDAAAAKVTANAIASAGFKASIYPGDISDWDVAAGLMQHCVDQFGALDGLVNNAGLYRMALAEEENAADFGRIVGVNLLGTAYCGIHALRFMTRQRSGSIINITSGSQAGIPYQASYSATKGAVASLTYTWAADVQGRGVRVNAVSPMANTAMAAQTTQYFIERDLVSWPALAATPEDNAPVVCYLLSDYAAAINGQVVRIDGKRLSLMTHPAVVYPPIERATWTVEDVRRTFETELSAKQSPIGLICLEAKRHPYPNEPWLPRQ